MPAPRMTTDEYLRLPEKMAPEELVYGFVRDAAAPTPGHQWYVAELLAALRAHVNEHRLGRVWPAPLDVVLDRERHLVVQPDLVFVSAERLGIVTDGVWGAPDLVVEILSPRPRIGTVEERVAWFASYGVRECWLVDQFARDVEVLEFAGGGVAARNTFACDTRIRSKVLPRFTRSLDDILEGLSFENGV